MLDRSSRHLHIRAIMATAMIWFALVVGAASQNLPQLTIDLDKLSVSGVSSGGAMAIQVCSFLCDRRNDHALCRCTFRTVQVSWALEFSQDPLTGAPKQTLKYFHISVVVLIFFLTDCAERVHDKAFIDQRARAG